MPTQRSCAGSGDPRTARCGVRMTNDQAPMTKQIQRTNDLMCPIASLGHFEFGHSDLLHPKCHQNSLSNAKDTPTTHQNLPRRRFCNICSLNNLERRFRCSHVSATPKTNKEKMLFAQNSPLVHCWESGRPIRDQTSVKKQLAI